MKKNKSFGTLIFICLISALSLSGQNYLSVQGNKLVDSKGQIVRLTGVNWFGFETSNLSVHGIWSRDTKSMLKQIKDQGFNVIRIPWCNKILDPSATILINAYGTDPYTGVSPMNEYESSLTKPIELLDVIVQWCQDNNMKIILDNHSRQPDGYMNELLWYTDITPESKWIEDWVFLASRYKNYDAVIGMDLNNEPHGNYGEGSSWGNSNSLTDWNKAAERCGNAILNVNPNVLIIVEGIERYEDDVYWWGGNLKGVADYPVQLNRPGKLVYSPHEYGPTVYNQPWFSAPDFPANMSAIWEEHFNFIHTQGISPLLVGEFGIRDSEGVDEIWFDTFLAYMDLKGYSWTFWCWNPNSGDTGGLLDDQWTNIVEWKMAKLRPYLAPEIPNGNSVPPENHAPVAVISADPVSGTAPLIVYLSASDSYDVDNDQLTYKWLFDDGSVYVGISGIHTFSEAGNYTVILQVTDEHGLTDVETIVIHVTDLTGNNPPVALIEASPLTGTEPLTVSFDAVNSYDPDNDVLSFIWNFGDGTTAEGVVVTHDYLEGTYNAVLTVSDGEYTDRETVTVVVNSQNSGPCDSPISISLPFTQEGIGEHCYATTSEILFVNSWNMEIVEINGIDFTNTWSSNLPEAIDGKWYIYYKGNYSWSHFEAATLKGNELSTINNTKLDLYPNPFSSVIRLKTNHPEEINRIEIIDDLGRTVFSLDRSQINSEILLGSELKQGVYYVRVYDLRGFQTYLIHKI